MRRQRITADIQLLGLVCDEPVPFQPGQYVSVGLLHNGSWIQRPYSPTGGADGAVLELLVRRVPGGRLTTRLCVAPIGIRLRIGPAKGLFRLAPGDRRDHLLLATGTGVAPLLSMTAALLAQPGPPRVVIVHGVRHTPELAFRRRLEGWANDFSHVTYIAAVSRPDGTLPAGIQSGRALDLLPAEWRRLELNAGSLVAYLCGNPDVVAAGARWLVKQGVDPAAVKREEYWPVTTDGSRAEPAAQ